MTKRERLIVLSIFISVFGFSLFNAVNPLEQRFGKPSLIVASEYISKIPNISERYSLLAQDFEVERQYTLTIESESKIEGMLSSVLGIPIEDIKESLAGGVKPSEMLASSGILLSDLEDEFNFEIVGDRGLVRFNV
jgi:hypothetical protein